MPAPPRPLIPLWARFLIHLRNKLPGRIICHFIIPALDRYGISGGEPRPLVHHPLAREQITSFLLGDDDAELWLLTRLIRCIEWELLLCNYHTATAMMQNLTNRIPVLISSPSYHYLWSRMLSQQGYIERAAWHMNKALECFLGYTQDWLRRSEESTVLKLVIELKEMRRAETADIPSKQFLGKLTQAYEGYVKMRHPKDLTFVHCDLFYMYLNYQYHIQPDDLLSDTLSDQNSHAIEVVAYHIQKGNFFGCHQLYKWVLKNVSTQFTLESVIQKLKTIFLKHTPDPTLLQKIIAELYFSSAQNILYLSNETGQITRNVLEYVWDSYEKAVMHAYRAGDELLITDINWAIFILDYNVDVDRNVVRQRKQKHEFIWYNFEIMYEDFLDFWKFYASRDDAARIRLILSQFDPVIQLCRNMTMNEMLDPIWAFYYMVTGDKTGEQPYHKLANTATRKLDVVHLLKSLDAYDEKYDEIIYDDEFDMLEYRLFSYQRLGKLAEGMPLAINFLNFAYEYGSPDDISLATYDYLLFKAALSHTILPRKRAAFFRTLRSEFNTAIAWDEAHLYKFDMIFKKRCMAAMFFADSWRYLKKYDALEEVFVSLQHLTLWHSSRKMKKTMSKQTRYQLEFYLCTAKYLCGYTKEAYIHAMKIARTFLPLPQISVWQGKTQYEKQNIQVFMDWMLLAIALYVDVVDNISLGGKSVRADLVELIDYEEFWKLVAGLEQYCVETGENNKLALGYHYLGWLMEMQENFEESMAFYDESLELMRDAQLYGIIGVRRNHLVPEFMKTPKPLGTLERAVGLQMKVRQRDKEVKRLIEEREEAYQREVRKFWANWRVLKDKRDKRRAKRMEKIKKVFKLRKEKKKEKKDDNNKKGPDTRRKNASIIQHLIKNGYKRLIPDDKADEYDKVAIKIAELEYTDSSDSEYDDDDKENLDPNASSPQVSRQTQEQQRRENTQPNQVGQEGNNNEEDEEGEAEKRRRAEIREGKKPMTGGYTQDTSPNPSRRSNPFKHTNHPERTNPQKPQAPRKEKKPKYPSAPPPLPETYIDPDLSNDIWNTSQEIKAWEYRRILGYTSLWDDQENLLNELNKIIAYSDPPVSLSQIRWVRELERLIRPGGGHGEWSYKWSYICGRKHENVKVKTAVKRLIRGDERITIPMCILTAMPAVIEDLYELRGYRGPGQAIVFVDYVTVENNLYMVYNIEKFRPVLNHPPPMCISHHILLSPTKDAVEGWVEEILFQGLHGKNFSKLMDLGRDLVHPIRKIARRGDLVIIGNSPLMNRVPFHAIPIGERRSRNKTSDFDESGFSENERKEIYEDEDDESLDDLVLPEITCEGDGDGTENWVTLGQYVDVVYSHGILVTKQAVQRLSGFPNRPKISTGMNRGCFCAVPSEGTSVAAQRATRNMLKKLTSRFGGDRMSLYAEPSGLTITELREQAMRTVDFLHFQGEVSINPEDDKPENTTLRMSEEMLFSAKNISGHLQFQMGCSPLVTIIGEQPDHIDQDARITEIPDGIPPAFLQSGASTVVTTLWPVPSQIADRFTEVFYSSFLKRGRLDGDQVWNIAQEVRVAASVVRRELGEGNSHWASFVMYGAWMRGFRPGGRIKVTKGKNVKTDFADYMQDESRYYPPPEYGLTFRFTN
ncbi:hypothetical protein TWF506_000322 [Arthrobotrys conoides]|uniref:CHAT domain-containing protein n=1 Tax=Arthrobotrys conoides TaxID=74498 RepID=A0AAN8NZZ2_9PEZI